LSNPSEMKSRQILFGLSRLCEICVDGELGYQFGEPSQLINKHW
jgi:hypothetical protein